MKQSAEIGKLAVALVAAQAELRAIAKDSVNPHFKSKFASLDTIIADVRPILARHQLAVVQGATTPESDASSHVTAITVETTLVHSSGEWLSSGVVIPLAKADPQGAGAAMTYGRRYGISALLCIATEEDDDGNTASQRSGAKGRAAPAARQSGATTAREVTSPKPAATAPALNQRTHMPFGQSKGTLLAAMDVKALSGAVRWARENKPDVYSEFIDAAEVLIEEKSMAGV